MVADALSRRAYSSVNAITSVQQEILKDLGRVGIELVFSKKPRLFLSNVLVQPTLLDEIKQA